MQLNTSTHTNHLVKILTAIYKNPYLNNYLGFKGGTALMLFYNLNRLSVDLDFDLTAKVAKNSAEFKKIIYEITKLLEKESYILKDNSEEYNTLFWAVSYGSGTKQIKVEISTKEQPFDTYEIKNLYGISIKTSTLPNLIAHKLVALVSRTMFANRDLFDTHYLLEKYPENINYQVIQDRLQKDPSEFYTYLLDFLGKMKSNNLLDSIGELINESQKNWIRDNLLKETKGLIQKQLDLRLWEG